MDDFGGVRGDDGCPNQNASFVGDKLNKAIAKIASIAAGNEVFSGASAVLTRRSRLIQSSSV